MNTHTDDPWMHVTCHLARHSVRQKFCIAKTHDHNASKGIHEAPGLTLHKMEGLRKTDTSCAHPYVLLQFLLQLVSIHKQKVPFSLRYAPRMSERTSGVSKRRGRFFPATTTNLSFHQVSAQNVPQIFHRAGHMASH